MNQALIKQSEAIEKQKRQLRTLYNARNAAQEQLKKAERTLQEADLCYAIQLQRRPLLYWFRRSVREAFDDLLWEVSGQVANRANYALVNSLNAGRFPHKDTPIELMYKALRSEGKATVRDLSSLAYAQRGVERIQQLGGKASCERVVSDSEQQHNQEQAAAAQQAAKAEVEAILQQIAPEEQTLQTLRQQAREQKQQMLAAGDTEGVMQYAIDQILKRLKLKEYQINLIDDYWQDDCEDGKKRMVMEIGDDFTEEEVFDREEVVGVAEFYPDGSWKAGSTLFEENNVQYTFGSDADEDLLLDRAVEYLKDGLECE